VRTTAVAVLSTRRARSLLLLGAILGLLAEQKIPFTEEAYGPLPDGGYYMNIAQHVRDGDGLITDLSLAHKGAPSLPHPTDMYPLWPLVYGYASRVFPIEPTGHWLPTIFYFVTLLVGFRWASELFDRDLVPRTVPGFHAGHLFVLMMGLNGEFFRYTSYPYTEGLTYAVVLLGLWRMNRLWERPSLRSGVEIGVWMGLATLCRKQLFLMLLAAVPVLVGAAVFARSNRRRFAWTGAGVLGGFALLAVPHYLYMSSFLPNMTPASFLRWDQNQHTDALTRLKTLRPAKTVGDYLRDRWQGVPIAFGTTTSSYTPQYHTFQYALPAAVPLALGAAVAYLRSGVLPVVRGLFEPGFLRYTYLFVFGVAGVLSIHTMHMYPDASGEWMFAGRHAITSLFLIFLANVALFSTPRFPGPAIGAFLLCSSVWLGIGRIDQWEKTQQGDENPRPSEFTSWINDERAKRGKLTIAMRQPQTLAHFTPGVGYHWFGDRTPFKDICAMTARLGVDYVALTRRSAYKRHPTFKTAFELVHEVPAGQFFRAVTGGPCAPPPAP